MEDFRYKLELLSKKEIIDVVSEFYNRQRISSEGMKDSNDYMMKAMSNAKITMLNNLRIMVSYAVEKKVIRERVFFRFMTVSKLISSVCRKGSGNTIPLKQ